MQSQDKTLYNKEALSIKNQIRLLKERGLIIKDDSKALMHLNNINYYHLSGYFKIFQKNNDAFVDGTTLDDVLNIYFFDKELRLLFMDGLEDLERSFNTQFVHHLSLKYNPYYLTDSTLFVSSKEKINDNIKKSKEHFIVNFHSKYSNEYPPMWILIEVLSFGDVLYFFNQLRSKDKKEISKYYKLGWPYLYSYLENLREVRNICAHYSRLWNRKITKKVKKSNDLNYLEPSGYLFDSIIIMDSLLSKISPEKKWLQKVHNLIKIHKIDTCKMGFPEDWENIFTDK